MPTTDSILTEPFTRKDYQQLPEGFPAELIDGMLVRQPPPTAWHQGLVIRIAHRLHSVVGPDRAIVSPVDVAIDEHNVLQPDLLLLAEEDRVRPGMKQVALPLMVFEVLSPSTARRDRLVKADNYLRAGVREVWLVDPDAGTIEIRTRDGATVFDANDEARSMVLPDFGLTFHELAG